MSLDFYLKSEHEEDKECFECGSTYKTRETLFSRNITHNLGEMANKAGIYKALWRPEEIKCKKAKDIIKILEKGIDDLEKRPEYFKQFDPSNGWGDYDGLLSFAKDVLKNCKAYPKSIIGISR